MRLPRICRRCASGSVRNCDCGERLSPSWRAVRLGRVDRWSTDCKSNSRAGSCGWQGGWPCRGRCKYVHVSSVAACSCALSCAHGKTGVGRPAQPARGMPRAHAAHAPARPTRPASGSFRWPPATEEKKKSNRGSRASLARSRAWLGSTRALQNQRKRTRRKPRPFSFPSVRQKPNALAHRHRETVEGGAGAAGRTAGAMDGAYEPPRTGLRRVLPAAPVPPNHQQPRAALDVDVDVDVARRRRTSARQRGASTSSPIGQLTPVPPIPQ